LLQIDVLSSLTGVEFNVSLSELIFDRDREVELFLFFGIFLLLWWWLSCSGLRIGFAFRYWGSFTFASRCTCGSLSSECTSSFIVNLLSLSVNLDVSKSINVMLINLDSLVSETVPDNESTFLDNITCLLTLVNIVHELR
jgi:hypothetical protein